MLSTDISLIDAGHVLFSALMRVFETISSAWFSHEFCPLLKGLESREVISLTRAKKTAQNAEMSTSIILALRDVVLVQSDKPWTFIISIIAMDNLTFKYIWYTTVYLFYCVLKASKNN